MNKRVLIGVFVCVLIFFACRWFGFELPSRLDVLESTIQTVSPSNTAVALSRVAKLIANWLVP